MIQHQVILTLENVNFTVANSQSAQAKQIFIVAFKNPFCFTSYSFYLFYVSVLILFLYFYSILFFYFIYLFYDHILNTGHNPSFDDFKILVKDSIEFRLYHRESFLISSDESFLNKYVKSTPLQLFIQLSTIQFYYLDY